MTATTDALRRLGDLVTSRRAELRLGVKPAARLAGINNATWKKVEDGLPVRDVTYAAVESALRWKHGSCQNVIGGGDPVVIDEAPEPERDCGADQTDGQPQLVEATDQFEFWKPAVVMPDLRDAIHCAAIATLPGATGAQIQAFEQRIEEELARRIARRARDANQEK